MRPWSRGFKGAPGNFDSPGGLCHNRRERFPKEGRMQTTRKTILAGISLLFVGAAGVVAAQKAAEPAPVNTTQQESTSDRKSTRLNSSHGYISYAVFCLKKKKSSQYCKRLRNK